jgi:hypothetical protein
MSQLRIIFLIWAVTAGIAAFICGMACICPPSFYSYDTPEERLRKTRTYKVCLHTFIGCGLLCPTLLTIALTN